jgi:hypothetical protein
MENSARGRPFSLTFYHRALTSFSWNGDVLARRALFCCPRDVEESPPCHPVVVRKTCVESLWLPHAGQPRKHRERIECSGGSSGGFKAEMSSAKCGQNADAGQWLVSFGRKAGNKTERTVGCTAFHTPPTSVDYFYAGCFSFWDFAQTQALRSMKQNRYV